MKLLRTNNIETVEVCQFYFGVSLPSVVWCYVTGLKDLRKNLVSIRSYLRRLSNPPGFIVCLFVLLFYLF